MTGQWKEPAAEDVKTLMDSVVIDRANSEDKVQRILGLVIQRVRGVVGIANTLSDNEAEVPPEGLQHTLVLTVFLLLSGTANFGFLIKGGDGSETGFGYSVRVAEKWLEAVQNGLPVTIPSNPSAAGGPGLVRWGSDDLVDHTSA